VRTCQSVSCMKVLIVLSCLFVACTLALRNTRHNQNTIMGQRQHVDPRDPLLHALNGVGCTEDDAAILAGDKALEKIKTCHFNCHVSKSMCVQCLTTHLDLTKGCGACYGDVMTCAVEKCDQCFTSPSGPSCLSCYHEKCSEQLKRCTKLDLSVNKVVHPYH